MVCVSRSLGTWDLTHFWIIFSDRTSCSIWQKVNTSLGQAPTSQARPRDTDHLLPSNLAARTLRLVEHTLPKSGRDPCPARRGLVKAVKCCVRKIRFSVSGQVVEQIKRSQSLGWVSTQRGTSVVFSVFRSHNCRPHSFYTYQVPGTGMCLFPIIEILFSPIAH